MEVMIKRGYLGCFVLFILSIGLIAIYFGYYMYLERYYITLYDGEMTRYLEIPSFAQRISPAEHEYFGVCTFSVSLLPEQAELALSSSCSKRGFIYRINDKGGFEIDITPTYKILGKFQDAYLVMIWDPILPEKIRRKAEKLVPPTKPASATFFLKHASKKKAAIE